MRCREARKRLTELSRGFVACEEEEALREHLNHCQDCARLVLAERLLTSDFEQLRQTQLSNAMTVEQVREGIAIRQELEKKTNLGVRIMRQVSKTFYRRPRLSLAAVAAFVLLLASLLVPVRTEHPVRYEVAFAAPGEGLVLNQENTERILAALDINDAKVQIHKTDSGVEYRIAPLQDSAKVRRLMAALDSLGGRQVRNEVESTKSESRTVWQLLLDDNLTNTDPPPQSIHTKKGTRIVNLNDEFEDDFTLWMPVGDQPSDSMQGLLLNRQGDKTSIHFVGMPADEESGDCGWNSLLSGNTVLNMRMPDGKEASFDLTDIDDVRELERAGYNFWLMEFDTPGKFPIPGMGPMLNDIEPNPFTDTAVIEYMVPQAYEVQVQILDKHGLEVLTLLNCIALAGIHQITWDGRDAYGNRVEPGAYLCRFYAGDYVETQEIVFER